MVTFAILHGKPPSCFLLWDPGFAHGLNFVYMCSASFLRFASKVFPSFPNFFYLGGKKVYTFPDLPSSCVAVIWKESQKLVVVLLILLMLNDSFLVGN